MNKKYIIKKLQILNKKDLISLEEQNNIIFDITEKEIINEKDYGNLCQAFENTKQLKEIIKRRNELIDILIKKERSKKC